MTFPIAHYTDDEILSRAEAIKAERLKVDYSKHPLIGKVVAYKVPVYNHLTISKVGEIKPHGSGIMLYDTKGMSFAMLGEFIVVLTDSQVEQIRPVMEALGVSV